MTRISCWRMNLPERWTAIPASRVMDLLKEVARERLVVMVTHNPELAEQYATRIVNLKDGTIRADSMPYEVNEEAIGHARAQEPGKSSMSFSHGAVFEL